MEFIDVIRNLQKQLQYKAEIVNEDVTGVDFGKRPFEIIIYIQEGEYFTARGHLKLRALP